MITLEEINRHQYSTTPEVATNLNILLERINKIRTLWAHPMTVTSGLRSQADQMLINPKAPHSRHLTGQAVDIADDEQLKVWLKATPQILIDCELWCEEGTNGWVHFQTVPPNSGHRWFLP